MAQNISQEELDKMRHTAAHVLAAASTILRPETRLGVGPATTDGFYHDIDVDEHYSEADLGKLQKEMQKIKQKNLPITQREVSKDEARQLFAHDPYKLELIDEIEGAMVGISDMGDGWFVTLCKGGHVESTGTIGEFQLTRLAGVYWRGDATRSQLQRIYGVLFPTKEELDEYLARLAEAKKRDHRTLGKELDLFSFSELVGPGLPLWTPRGTVIRQVLDDYVWALRRHHGYQKVEIPHITKKELFERSGHWGKFSDELFRSTTREGHEFAIKPMNCPFHTQIFDRRQHSYREMPQRYANTTMVYRDEQTGELQGLMRVRSITQDDAHVFCREDQFIDEAMKIWDIIEAFYRDTGFGELRVRLSLRDPKQPEKYQGDDELWQRSESQLRDIINQKGVTFTEAVGEAAFYGPKIDFLSSDSLGREWQVATIQADRSMPENFDLTCINEHGERERIVMIHAAIMGALERFISILLEHHAGHLPLWLAPEQVRVLPISDEQLEYASAVARQLSEAGLRVATDGRSESIGKKIREAQVLRVPVMLIVGQKEVADGTVSVRSHARGDEGAKNLSQVVDELAQAVHQRAV